VLVDQTQMMRAESLTLAQPYFESDDDRASYVEAVRLIDATRSPELRVDLSQVAAMKVLADSVFIKKFRELFEEHGGRTTRARRPAA
jgi:hypothetical protein